MTPTQLSHLRAIDAQLAKLLGIAAKRTPGEWKTDYSVSFNHIVTDAESRKPLNQRKAIATTHKMYSADRAAADIDYIASCSNNAEAGWRSTKAAIEDWLNLYSSTEGYADGAPDASAHDKLCNEVASICRINLRHILAEWPLESLTPTIP